jgi:hypothetical protein
MEVVVDYFKVPVPISQLFLEGTYKTREKHQDNQSPGQNSKPHPNRKQE